MSKRSFTVRLTRTKRYFAHVDVVAGSKKEARAIAYDRLQNPDHPDWRHAPAEPIKALVRRPGAAKEESL